MYLKVLFTTVSNFLWISQKLGDSGWKIEHLLASLKVLSESALPEALKSLLYHHLLNFTRLCSHLFFSAGWSEQPWLQWGRQSGGMPASSIQWGWLYKPRQLPVWNGEHSFQLSSVLAKAWKCQRWAGLSFSRSAETVGWFNSVFPVFPLPGGELMWRGVTLTKN